MFEASRIGTIDKQDSNETFETKLLRHRGRLFRFNDKMCLQGRGRNTQVGNLHQELIRSTD